MSAGLRILLADDHFENRRIGEIVLGHMGHHIITVANDAEAVAAVAASGDAPFDAIFMDCHMPEMDGFEASRQIRAHESEVGDGHQSVIFALTASSIVDERDRCTAAGMTDFLEKPLSFEGVEVAFRRYFPESEAHGASGGRAPASAAPAPAAVSAPAPAPAHAAVDSNVIDAAHVAEVREMTDDETYVDMLVAFANSVRRALGAVQMTLRSEPDYGLVRASAHSLKGAAASVGARGIRLLGSRLEGAALDEDPDAIKLLLPQIEAAAGAFDTAARGLLRQ